MDKYFEFKDIKGFYQDEGTGEVIVLVHGFCFDGSIWDSLKETLAQSYRVIIPDLPVEVYLSKFQTLFTQYEIGISFLITPQTSEQRIIMLDRACSSFLYIVSDNSLTGANTSGFGPTQIAYFETIKELNLTSPTMIGFGISSRKMVEQANLYSNGAIIGSAYLESIRLNSEKTFIDKLV